MSQQAGLTTLARASQVALVVKNGKESAFNAEDMGSIPGPGRSPREGNGNLLWYLAWEIPWAEEPGGLQSKGSQKCWTTMKSCYSYVL